jgi:hypothetical protein
VMWLARRRGGILGYTLACWPAWHRRRRANALAALGSMGIPVPGLPQPPERNAAAERWYQEGLRIAANQVSSRLNRSHREVSRKTESGRTSAASTRQPRLLACFR